MTGTSVTPARPGNDTATAVIPARVEHDTKVAEQRQEALEAAFHGLPLELHQPFCSSCAEVSHTRLESDAAGLGPSGRRSPEQLHQEARLLARMVRFCGEWLCPRCELVDVGTYFEPQLVPLASVLPNRDARRVAERWLRTHTRQWKWSS
jgi:hypothetical protein